MSYVNRHYVKRAVDEDRGWLRLADVLESVTSITSNEESREVISRKFREKRLRELKKWGYNNGDPDEKATFAESCAEAASPADRVVPVLSLAHRRFRVEYMEPLLAAPKAAIKGKSKVKHKVPKPSLGPNPTKPKGRLARAVQCLFETDTVDEVERMRLASSLANALQVIGVREEHSLRKKLAKYVLASPSSQS